MNLLVDISRSIIIEAGEGEWCGDYLPIMPNSAVSVMLFVDNGGV